MAHVSVTARIAALVLTEARVGTAEVNHVHSTYWVCIKNTILAASYGESNSVDPIDIATSSMAVRRYRLNSLASQRLNLSMKLRGSFEITSMYLF